MTNKILIFGAGYVGTSLSILLSQQFEVVLIDIDKSKVDKINSGLSPIDEEMMKDFLKRDLNLTASQNFKEYINKADLIILALPTNYDEEKNFFDTKILDATLCDLNNLNFKNEIVIKSTIPIGYTINACKKYPKLNIIFVPEFLREGQALTDNLYPSRIVIGSTKEKAFNVASIFNSISKNNPNIFYMSSSEAEAVKLFANTYLATRVSFFNELDSFALEHNLNAKNIINGVSSDPRIGKGYNNPSFGYGGYCLPKDTKQLLANFENIPQGIFGAVVKSNQLRKEFIASKILEKKPKRVGIFRLVMKKGSDNFRESAIFSLMELLEAAGVALLIFEPLIYDQDTTFALTHDLEHFKRSCDLILANRMDDSLLSVANKVFTRDVYGEN
jgi:UDPglucose 6-dehydrogenase